MCFMVMSYHRADCSFHSFKLLETWMGAELRAGFSVGEWAGWLSSLRNTYEVICTPLSPVCSGRWWDKRSERLVYTEIWEYNKYIYNLQNYTVIWKLFLLLVGLLWNALVSMTSVHNLQFQTLMMVGWLRATATCIKALQAMSAITYAWISWLLKLLSESCEYNWHQHLYFDAKELV